MSIINEMLNDSTLSDEDKEWIRKFLPPARSAVRAACHERGVNGLSSELNAVNLASSKLGIDAALLHKESALLYALWVVLLSVIKETMRREDYKYQTLDSFMAAYDGRFDHESDNERINLLNTANWMNILFRIIPARKNKGLAIQIVPKIVEGWDAKYVTGSGQTRATQNRVFIFESEGNTKATQRGKAKALMQQQQQQQQEQAQLQQQQEQLLKKKKGAGALGKRSAEVLKILPLMNGKKKKVEQPTALPQVQPGLVGPYPAPPAPLLFKQNFPRRVTRSISGRLLASGAVAGLDDGARGADGDAENEPEKLHKGVKKALQVFTALGISRDESIFGLGQTQHNDAVSLNAGGLSANPNQQLMGPPDYQRGYTWTEVDPVIAPAEGNGAQNPSLQSMPPVMQPMSPQQQMMMMQPMPHQQQQMLMMAPPVRQSVPYQMLPPVGSYPSVGMPAVEGMGAAVPAAPPLATSTSDSLIATSLGALEGESIQSIFAGYT